MGKNTRGCIDERIVCGLCGAVPALPFNGPAPETPGWIDAHHYICEDCADTGEGWEYIQSFAAAPEKRGTMRSMEDAAHREIDTLEKERAKLEAEVARLRSMLEWCAEQLANGRDFDSWDVQEQMELRGLYVPVPADAEFRSRFENSEDADTMLVLAWHPLAAAPQEEL